MKWCQWWGRSIDGKDQQFFLNIQKDISASDRPVLVQKWWQRSPHWGTSCRLWLVQVTAGDQVEMVEPGGQRGVWATCPGWREPWKVRSIVCLPLRLHPESCQSLLYGGSSRGKRMRTSLQTQKSEDPRRGIWCDGPRGAMDGGAGERLGTHSAPCRTLDPGDKVCDTRQTTCLEPSSCCWNSASVH